jgi:predicted enzyme related to lactoylglutathione lyase
MNPVIGFQITAQDFAGLNEFYAQSFGWDITPGPHENVTAIAAGPADAGDFEGSTIARGEHIPDYVSLCIGTHDIEATVARTLAHGATLIRPPFELPQGDVLAIVSDPEGHVLTLVQKVAEK